MIKIGIIFIITAIILLLLTGIIWSPPARRFGKWLKQKFGKT